MSNQKVAVSRTSRTRCGALGVVVAIAACSSNPEAEPIVTPPTVTTRDGGVVAEPEPEVVPTEAVCALKGPPVGTPGEVLVNGEDFDGTSLDLRKWTVADGYKGHGEILSSVSPANALVHDGSLFIATDRDPTNTTYPYRSGWIDTLGKYARTYGKIEFRARFPAAKGVWYAIWGRPWSQSFPEIDIEIMNMPAKKKPEIYFVNHWAAPPLPADQRRSFTAFDNVDITVFHTYTILWKPDLLEWSVDGVPKMQAKPQGIPNLPVYWMLNGWVGGWGGVPTDATPLPATFEVDYVHIYRVDGLIADPVVKVLSPKDEYSRKDTIEVALANFDEACAHVEFFDNGKLVWRTSTAPFAFPLSRLRRAGAGVHKLEFVATDGVRKTSSKLEVPID